MVRKSERFPDVEWVGETGAFIKIDEKKCTAAATV